MDNEISRNLTAIVSKLQTLKKQKLWGTVTKLFLSSFLRDSILAHQSPDSKVHGANMGPIWGRQDPGGPHVGPMNFVI